MERKDPSRVQAGRKAAHTRGYDSLSAAGRKGAESRSHESRVEGGRKAAHTRGYESLAAAGRKGGKARAKSANGR